ncbi:MAG: putative dsRNA-binding protein [Planctomycetota bacterium]
MSAPSIHITFLGGASHIGASSALVQVGENRLLIDCGVRFRQGDALPDFDALAGGKLAAVLVTHAHSDHSGALPVLHEAYPGTPIYATPPTIDLVTILQRDALKLMSIAAECEGEVPLYSRAQVEAMLSAMVPVQHGSSITIGDIEVTYLPASHILGASMIHLATAAGHVLFTGDYSVSAQLTVPAFPRPALPVDLLVTESTYGNRMHASRSAAENRLVERVRLTLEGGGRVLIPAFAIGRAQEVLLILKRALRRGALPEVPVFVDGMVRPVCDVYTRHERYVSRTLSREIKRERHPFFGSSIQPVSSPDQRNKVLQTSPCVIVASSGMLAGGPSAFYAAELAGSERDAILITGYQDEESPGKALISLAERQGPREMLLGGKRVDVRCALETYGLSAHADRMQMAGLVESLNPRTVILVHGDGEARQALATALSRHEVILASEGRLVGRTYPRRRTAAVRQDVAALPESPEAAAAMLPSDGRPLPLTRIAEAWFGRRVDLHTRQRLAERLEELGVARRDDSRRELLWAEAGVVPGAAERALEDELKAANPKGRLLELCMRQRLEPPAVDVTEVGSKCRIEMTLDVAGERIASGRHEAGSRKLAEQLAARALLDEIGRRSQVEDFIQVCEEEEARLKALNPKGRLLEFCMQRRLPPPGSEVRAVPSAWVAQASGRGPSGEMIVSRLYRAGSSKGAEQAAAADLLENLIAEESRAEGRRADVSKTGQPVREARAELNHLRQRGCIADFGYEIVARDGPSHSPIFVMRAWALLPDGTRLDSAPVDAPTRKEAERDAASRLLDLVKAGSFPGEARGDA